MTADLSSNHSSPTGDSEHLQPEGKPPHNQPAAKFKLLAISIVVILLMAGLLAVKAKLFPAQDANFIDVNGRIEAPETYITAGVGTTVKTVLVKEGDSVQKGQPILRLDTSALNVKMRATGSEENLAREAQSQAKNQVAATQQKVDEAQKKSKGFFAKIFTSKKKKEEIKEQLTEQMKAAQMQSFQAKTAIIKAQAAKGEVTSKLPYFEITSPLTGICVTRSVEPGEVVAPGQVLLSIIDPRAIYMKGFVAEGYLSQIKLGQQATIILDAEKKQEGKHLKAKVTAIDSAPSFTPQNIYFKNDRIRQVFGIKLSILDPDGSAKAGMPAEARIKNEQSTSGQADKQ